MEIITSVHNPLVKQCAALQDSGSRRKTGLFLLEGVKLCKEALACGLNVRYCFWCDHPSARALAAACAHSIQTTDAVIAKLSEAKTPQHIVMVAEIPAVSSADMDGQMILALDGISDPANLGSMLRTAEAFGVRDVLCSDTTVDLWSTKVLRGAMGSSFRVRVHRGELLSRLAQLRTRGYRLIATGLDQNAQKLQDVDFSEPVVIVIGNEGNGVRKEIFALCDQSVYIPMAGQNESLNAAAAAAVVLWQGFRGGMHG